jgi:glycerate kinase
VPLADGGEGTAAALLAATGGRWAEADVHDALGRPCRARFALLADGSAAVDVAEAVGALRVADRDPEPLRADSRGAGELIRAALDAGARRVVVGVGGTATTDGGAGLREALGELPAGTELVAALDVRNPLLGRDGAAAVYGPQKGATPEQVQELEARLRALHLPTAELPGAGAGGGIGAMLMAIGAHPASGGGLVMDAVGIDRRLADADRCITAEGRIDTQTLSGKVVALVAERCRSAGVPCTAVGGAVEAAAAAALARAGCATHRQGDLERAGRELATAWPDP